MHLSKRRGAIIPLIVVCALVVGGAAIAFWTSTGTGSGTATVGTTAGLTLTPVTITGTLYPGGTAATVGTTAGLTLTPVTITGTLYPGGTAATSSITINNPGASAVRVTNISLNTAQPTTGNQQLSGIGGLPAAGCPAADFTFNANLPGGFVNVPAGGSAVVTTGTLSMANTAVNQDACKGLTLTIYLRAT